MKIIRMTLVILHPDQEDYELHEIKPNQLSVKKILENLVEYSDNSSSGVSNSNSSEDIPAPPPAKRKTILKDNKK